MVKNHEVQTQEKLCGNCVEIEINFQSDIFNFFLIFILFGQSQNIQAMVILRKHFLPMDGVW